MIEIVVRFFGAEKDRNPIGTGIADPRWKFRDRYQLKDPRKLQVSLAIGQ